MQQLAEIKDGARAAWALGDYDAMLRQERLHGVGERLVDRVGVEPGDRVLDVACGTGNATLPAARTGAEVTGLDLSPAMLERARGHAAAEGLDVDWREGDAEQLPFADESFDVVVSSFGCMFAPRHDVAAEEMARVLRPGGRLGVCSWTPEGVFGEFFRIVGGHLPPDPAFVDPPPLWGDEDHVRRLFEGTGISLTCSHERWEISHDSAEAAVECYTTTLGPLVGARRITEAEGRWPALADDLRHLFERWDTSGRGQVDLRADYLVVMGRKAT
jgi:SAM-dependent methyltransferase